MLIRSLVFLKSLFNSEPKLNSTIYETAGAAESVSEPVYKQKLSVILSHPGASAFGVFLRTHHWNL